MRDYFESRFGYDFARVRVHTDDVAARSARSLGALAYTVGSDIVFARGQYAPASSEGRRLLAHELAHVVQQGRGAPLQIARQSDPANPSAPVIGDPRYPLQIGCVKDQGACTRTRDGGVPDPSTEAKGYNDRCRSRTGWTGPDVWPNDVECLQTTSQVLAPDRLEAFKALAREAKQRFDAGKMSASEMAQVGDAVRLVLIAMQRAGMDTQPLIDKAVAQSSDPGVAQAYLAGPAFAKLLADFEAGALAGGAGAAGAGAGAAGAETAVAGATGVAAGTAAAVVVGAVVVLGVILLIAYIILNTPDSRADRLAPRLLDEATRRMTDAIQKSRAREAAPVPTTTTSAEADVDVDEKPETLSRDCDQKPNDCKPKKIQRKGGNSKYTRRHNRCADKVTLPDLVGRDICVGGKAFDGLDADNVLWEIKGHAWSYADIYKNPVMANRILTDLIKELLSEWSKALLCGFKFKVGVRDAGLLDVLKKRAPSLPVELVKC